MTDREKVIEKLKELLALSRYNDSVGWNPDSDTDTLADTIALLKAQEPITGETSDGYHTFNELYHHRAVLFSVIVANYKDRAWKSVRHHDGTMYAGMFIVGIDTPDGQATYHYDIDPYWDMFDCKVREFAPYWDGHTPAQAIERIGGLAGLKVQEPRVMTLEEVKHFVYGNPYIIEMVLSDGEYRLMYGLFSHQGVVGNCDFVTVNERIRLYDADYGKTWRVWTGCPTSRGGKTHESISEKARHGG